MVKRRYFAVAAIAVALYMLYALYICCTKTYCYGYIEAAIVVGVFAVLAFALTAFALVLFVHASAFSTVAFLYGLENKRLFLDIAVGLNTAISIFSYAVLMIDEEPIYGLIGLLAAIIICAFYYVGLCFKREAQNRQYLFDLCYLLAFCMIGAFCAMGALIGWVCVIVALAIFMVYCFANTNRIVWYILAGVAGAACLGLGICGFIIDTTLIGFIALVGVVYAMVYFLISYLRERGAGYNAPTAKGGLSADDIKQLEQLHELMLQGVITEEQFQSQKEKILGGK